MKKFIEDWIKNCDRDLAVGVQIFEALASDQMKSRYLSFVKQRTEHPFARVLLLDKVKSILQSIILQPSAFEGKELPFLVKSKGEKADGLIVKTEDLPEAERNALAWNKKNTPLIASIHSELSNEGITDEKRQELAVELIALVETRHDNWDLIDAFLEGRTIEGHDPQEDIEDSIPMLRGVQIARRIERLKENIKRSEKVVGDTKAKKLIRENATQRVKSYTEELTALEEELNKVENDPTGI